MKVFCPVHERSFIAPRSNPIKCLNKYHPMGDLDFDGQAKEEVETLWQHCCNCEHFWPLVESHHADTQCPVCSRQLSPRYLCDRCYTITCESPTSIETNSFTVTSEGGAQPSCPGCLEPPAGLLREHQCEELAASFISAFASCPFCSQVIGAAPAFPFPAGQYLEKVKAYQGATIDYERELFIAAEKGEFAIVPQDAEPARSALIPQRERFASKRDFYEHYQDFFICDNPVGGEVVVIQPAMVDQVEGGWQLAKPGILEIMDRPAQETRANPEGVLPLEEACKPSEQTTTGGAELAAACASCGAPNSAKNENCWECGRLLELSDLAGTTLATSTVVDAPQMISAPASKPSPVDRLSTLLSAAAVEDKLPLSSGPFRNLVTIVMVGLVALTVSFLIVTRIAGGTGGAPNALSNEQANEGSAQGRTPGQTQTQLTAAQTAEGSLINQLLARGANSADASRRKLIELLATAESKYPTDYRFTYERARLLAARRRDQQDAFGALFNAAEKAIDQGQAAEMLNDLRRDKQSAFRRLSPRREEWGDLEAALEKNDRSALKA